MTRVPPQSKEAEQSVLGAMMLDNTCIPEILQIIKTDDFYQIDHRNYFALMVAMYKNHEVIDFVTLRAKYPGGIGMGNIQELIGMAEAVPSAANNAYYARIVADKSRLRQVIQVTAEIQQAAYCHFEGDVNEFVDQAASKVNKIAQGNMSETARSLSEIIPEVVESFLSPQDNSFGLPTGFTELDKKIGGLKGGELIVVAGRPSMGKSAFVCNLIEHTGATLRIPSIWFSIEMDKRQVVERIVTGAGGMTAQHLGSKMATDHDIEQFQKTISEIYEWSPIIIDDNPRAVPLTIQARVRALQKLGVGLIVIDYLQLIHVPGHENKRLEIGYITREMKRMARELNVPVILVSQLSREAERRVDHRPYLSDLRESGDIEQDADIVILLFRPDYYERDSLKHTNIAEVHVAKNRSGPTGLFELVWNGEMMKFKNRGY